MKDFLQIFREVFADTPKWFRIWMLICLVAGPALLAYSFYECGWKTLLLGNGAAFAAFTGMCQ